MILNDQQIQELLQKYPEWRLDDGKLVKEISLSEFKPAMQYVNEVAKIAEQQGHHPDITIRYNNVMLEIYSHDNAKITDRDVAFIEAVENIPT